jgi:hypothetical protein
LDVEVIHQTAQGSGAPTVFVELSSGEGSNVARWGDHLQAELILARIDHPDKLDQEGVKLDPVIPAIGGDKGDGGRRPGLDAAGGPGKGPDVCPQSIKHTAIRLHAATKFLAQALKALWVDHAGP